MQNDGCKPITNTLTHSRARFYFVTVCFFMLFFLLRYIPSPWKLFFPQISLYSIPFLSFFCLFLCFIFWEWLQENFYTICNEFLLLLSLSKMATTTFFLCIRCVSFELLHWCFFIWHFKIRVNVYCCCSTRKHQTTVSQLNIHIKLMSFEDG